MIKRVKGILVVITVALLLAALAGLPACGKRVLTTTTVTSSGTLSVYGDSVTFTATVSPTTGTNIPTGTVTFNDGTTILGNVTLSSGQATYVTSTLPAGDHTITATYGGNANFAVSTSASITQMVYQASTRQFGTGSDDDARAMVADVSGNIYVAGWTGGTFSGQTSSGNGDAFIAKYDSSGNEVWTRQFGTSSYDVAYAMVADGSGNIYVAGWTGGTFSGQTSSGNIDAFIAKYDSSGNEAWTRQFGTGGDDFAQTIVADESRNVYVAGYTTGTFSGQTSSGNGDAFIAKYGSSGNAVWTRQFGTGGDDSACAIVADGSGNIYVADGTGGTLSGQTSSGNGDAYIAKYDSSGNQVWTRQFGTGGNDWAIAMIADGSGNIYVAGGAEGTFPGQTSSGNIDAFIAKYDGSGNQVWTRQFGSSGDDYTNAMATDRSGNIYVAGYTFGTFSGQTSSGEEDAFIAKYDSSGNAVWQFGTSSRDYATAVVADELGNIYVAGRTSGTFPGQSSSGGDTDVFIMKLRK